MSGVVTVVAKVRSAKGKAGALQELLIEQAATVRRTETGCVAYRVPCYANSWAARRV